MWFDLGYGEILNNVANGERGMTKKKVLLVLLLCFCLCIGCEGVDDRVTDDDDSNNSQTADSGFSIDWIWENETTDIRIQGVVKNNNRQTYTGLKIHLTARDANNNLLGVYTDYIEPQTLAPGQEGIFTSYIWDKTCPTDTLKLTCNIEHD